MEYIEDDIGPELDAYGRPFPSMDFLVWKLHATLLKEIEAHLTPYLMFGRLHGGVR